MKKKHLFIALIIAILLTVAVNVCFTFYRNLNSAVLEDVEVRLHEITTPNMVSFHLQMQEQISKVTTLADLLGIYGILNDETAHSLLRATAENNGLLRCAIVLPDATVISSDNKTEANADTAELVRAAMEDTVVITDPLPSEADGNVTVIRFAAPIKHNGSVIGSVITTYPADNLDSVYQYH